MRFCLAALLPALALAACQDDPPPAPPAPPTAADDSVSAVLADTAGATAHYTGRHRTLTGEGAIVHVWLRPDGQLVWAEDDLDGRPLNPQRGTYTTTAGADGRDTLAVALLADSLRFVRTADSLLETRRDTLVVEHLLRLAQTPHAAAPTPRAPSTTTPATPDEAAREAVEEAAREAERLPGGSPGAPPRQAPRRQ